MQTQALVIRDLTSRSPRRWRPSPKWSKDAASPPQESKECKQIKPVKQEIPEPVIAPLQPEQIKKGFNSADSEESPASPSSSTNFAHLPPPPLEPPTPVKFLPATQPDPASVKQEIMFPGAPPVLPATTLNGPQPARLAKTPDQWSLQFMMAQMTTSELADCLSQAEAPGKLINFVVEKKVTGRDYLLHSLDRGPLPKLLSRWDMPTSRKFVETHLRNIVVGDHLSGYAPY